jgi:hypothetical protein
MHLIRWVCQPGAFRPIERRICMVAPGAAPWGKSYEIPAPYEWATGAEAVGIYCRGRASERPQYWAHDLRDCSISELYMRLIRWVCQPGAFRPIERRICMAAALYY